MGSRDVGERDLEPRLGQIKRRTWPPGWTAALRFM